MSSQTVEGVIAAVVDDKAIVVQLLADALDLFDHDLSMARHRIELACGLASRRDVVEAPGLGALAPWQARRVMSHIEANLGATLRIEKAATIARLSASYFSRAFKVTYGLSFSDYVTARRVRQAKHLLLTTNRPICEIALDCGLADQSHLTRLFSRRVGLPPNAWRRSSRVVEVA